MTQRGSIFPVRPSHPNPLPLPFPVYRSGRVGLVSAACAGLLLDAAGVYRLAWTLPRPCSRALHARRYRTILCTARLRVLLRRPCSPALHARRYQPSRSCTARPRERPRRRRSARRRTPRSGSSGTSLAAAPPWSAPSPQVYKHPALAVLPILAILPLVDLYTEAVPRSVDPHKRVLIFFLSFSAFKLRFGLFTHGKVMNFMAFCFFHASCVLIEQVSVL